MSRGEERARARLDPVPLREPRPPHPAGAALLSPQAAGGGVTLEGPDGHTARGRLVMRGGRWGVLVESVEPLEQVAPVAPADPDGDS